MVTMLKRVLAGGALAAAGVVVGLVGAVSHRSVGLVGAVLSLLLVATAAVFAKAWRGWEGFALFAVAFVVPTLIAGQSGPGGGVLIADDALGITWLAGSAAVIVAVAVAPRRWWVGRDVAR